MVFFIALLLKSFLSNANASHLYNLSWGSFNIKNSSCPIVYPFFNESSFCSSVGRQRYIVEADHESDIACAHLKWRLRTDLPSNIGAFVTDSNGNFTPSTVLPNATTHSGDVCFLTTTNSKMYSIYFLPYAWSFSGGSGSYHAHFLDRLSTPPLLSMNNNQMMVSQKAKITAMESFSDFDVRSPMEYTATPSEMKNIMSSGGYATWVSLISNTSTQTIRMKDLPLELAISPPNTSVTISRGGGEEQKVRAVQIVLFAANTDIDGVSVEFIDGDVDQDGTTYTCLQTSGTDYNGNPMTPPPVNIKMGDTGQLLILIDSTNCSIDTSRKQTMLKKKQVKITPIGLSSTLITISMDPCAYNTSKNSESSESSSSNPVVTSDIWQLSRLSWLNSKVGISDTITRPYSALILIDSDETVNGNPTLKCRGRTVSLSSATGLPSALTSNARHVLFNQHKNENENEGGAAVQFTVHDKEGHPLTFRADTLDLNVLMGPGNSTATWSKTLQSSGDAPLTLTIEGRMDFDGHLDYCVILSSSSSTTVDVDSASLVMLVDKNVARFANGGGLADNGGWFPTENPSLMNWSWKDFNRKTYDPNTPAGGPPEPSGWRMWLGDVDAGIFLKLKGDSVAWNEASPRAGSRGFEPPLSWAGQDGSSGSLNVSSSASSISPSSSSIRVEARSGPIQVLSGDGLRFNFTLMATPTKGDWTHTAEGKRGHYLYSRHYHVPYGDWNPTLPCDLKKTVLPGLTTYILHQSNKYNPYIDWPFHPNVMPSLQHLIVGAAKCNVRVKLYFTIGQMTNHNPEVFALEGMNGEILLENRTNQPAPSGPSSSFQRQHRRRLGMGGNLTGNGWLMEHLVHGYEGGWFTQNPNHNEDASIGNNVTSRFMNYYIEGQKWLFEKLNVGGLYYDGFTAERRVQRRVRRMSESVKHKDGKMTDESQIIRYDIHGRAFQNTELLPYIDNMWTCEGIDFTQGPAYWLISISALPFGTFGEMLGADDAPPVPGHFCGESCANKWRGMLFGMSNRAGWVGQDPNNNAELWNVWDTFEIEKADMWGWWNVTSPIQVIQDNNNDKNSGIFVTSYVRVGNQTLVAVATWTNGTDTNVTLKIDWNALGLSNITGKVTAPGLSSFNGINETKYFPSKKGDTSQVPLEVKAYKGWLLVLSD